MKKNGIAIFDGDSLCEALADNRRGWAARVADYYGLENKNFSVSGATITAEMYTPSGNPRHWVSRNIDKIHEQCPDAECVIFDGGSNDADLLGIGSERLGVLDPNDFSGNYDDSTFIGAMETLFYKTVNYYPTAKIGFIICQKMGKPTDKDGKYFMRAHYFGHAKEVCKKWGIPCLDLWDECPLNPSLLCYFDSSLDKEGNVKEGKAYIDGQHLTTAGYDIISDRIISFVGSL